MCRGGRYRYDKVVSLVYADDIVIFSNTMEGLQRGLDVLAGYCKKWKLTINTEKTKYGFQKKKKKTRKLCL